MPITARAEPCQNLEPGAPFASQGPDHVGLCCLPGSIREQARQEEEQPGLQVGLQFQSSGAKTPTPHASENGELNTYSLCDPTISFLGVQPRERKILVCSKPRAQMLTTGLLVMAKIQNTTNTCLGKQSTLQPCSD